MQRYSTEIIGIATAGASLFAAYAKTMMPLRMAAVVANLLAMLYCWSESIYAIFLLNAALLPLNAFRLYSMRKLIRDIDAAIKGDLSADWLLPYMRPKAFKAGENMIARGEYATAAYYVVSGEVEIVETGETFGKGTLLGEIGLFAPDGRRMMTVRCKTRVQTARIDYDRFKELYFQNPQFGFHLIHMVVARLQSGRQIARDIRPPA
jgi:CRP/FNR family transcriptional regulator, cyclic AMP receptor protein